MASIEHPEKLLPSNAEAEVGVLGSIEIDPDALPRVQALGLTPGDFDREAHRALYAAMVDWRAKTGDTPDLITLCDELGRRGVLEDLGGTSFVGSFANQVPTSRNAEHYARIVLRTATLRRLIRAAGKIAGVAYNEPDADVALEQAFSLLHEVDAQAGKGIRHHARRGEGYTFEEAMDAVEDEFFQQLDGQPVGLQTGFADLDQHTAGLLGGELVYLVARPSMGKSSLVAAIALNVAFAGGHVEWVTLEMSARQLVKRLISMESGLDTRVIRAGFRRADGSTDEGAHTSAVLSSEALRRQVENRIHFFDTRMSVEALSERLEWAVAERGCRLGIVDYFGLLSREEGRGRGGMSRVERMTEISSQLKQIALTLNIPLIVLAQLNREVTHRADQRPELSDIRETGGTEQDADHVWGLHRPAYYDRERAARDGQFAHFAELHVLKARDGAAGVTVPLRFDGPSTRFTDWPSYWPWPTVAGKVARLVNETE